ncbi:MAG: hypothetical protein FWG79_09680 [Bacteroidales bacterium]|nr:hypothetical protein [Bacteroidales bacterium]
MKKTNKTLVSVGKYFREVSAVVLGVAITVSATVLINNQIQKKDTEYYLHSIKLELENITIPTLEGAINYYRLDAQYAQYLLSHDAKSYHADSIEYYRIAYQSIQRFSLSTNAFEMLKNFRPTRTMDKNLLLNLSAMFSYYSRYNDIFEWYFNTKWAHLEKAPTNNTADIMFDKNNPVAPLFDFYKFRFGKPLLQDCEALLEGTKQLLSLLEDYN